MTLNPASPASMPSGAPPVQSSPVAGSPVRAAIATAARATGMDFDFLLSTAVRESSLNPMAEASTSSATGLFQFLDQTWLATVKRHGARHGMGAEASMIQIGGDGIARVDDPQARRAILAMRYDPELSARMAAEFASDNADMLRVRTGREPQTGDLYAAHFLGAGGASELILAADSQPWARAADLFPQAAGANRPVFYDRDGRPKTVVEVLQGLRATARREAPPVSQVEFAGSGATFMHASRWAGGAGAAQSTNPALEAALAAQHEAERNLLALIGSDSSGDGNPLSGLFSAGMVDAALDARRGGSAALQAQLMARQDEAIQQAAADLINSGRERGSIATALSPSAESGSRGGGSDDDSGSGSSSKPMTGMLQSMPAVAAAASPGVDPAGPGAGQIPPALAASAAAMRPINLRGRGGY